MSDGIPSMTSIEDLAALIEVQSGATISKTVMSSEGARLVLFSFDTGQELTEHTAAMPVVLSVVEGHVRVTADERTVDLRPGGMVHLATRLPHSVEAVEPTKLALLMLDSR